MKKILIVTLVKQRYTIRYLYYFWKMKIKDVIDYLEDFAPISLQEDYDNSGLNIGNINN